MKNHNYKLILSKESFYANVEVYVKNTQVIDLFSFNANQSANKIFYFVKPVSFLDNLLSKFNIVYENILSVFNENEALEEEAVNEFFSGVFLSLDFLKFVKIDYKPYEVTHMHDVIDEKFYFEVDHKYTYYRYSDFYINSDLIFNDLEFKIELQTAMFDFQKYLLFCSDKKNFSNTNDQINAIKNLFENKIFEYLVNKMGEYSLFLYNYEQYVKLGLQNESKSSILNFYGLDYFFNCLKKLYEFPNSYYSNSILSSNVFTECSFREFQIYLKDDFFRILAVIKIIEDSNIIILRKFIIDSYKATFIRLEYYIKFVYDEKHTKEVFDNVVYVMKLLLNSTENYFESSLEPKVILHNINGEINYFLNEYLYQFKS